MKGLSRIKAWLLKKGFTQTLQVGDTTSEYFRIDDFPMAVRMGDHLGRSNTVTEKYINVLMAKNSESYVLIIDKVTKVVTFKELTDVINSLMVLYNVIPEYLKFRNDLRKEFQQKETDFMAEINSLNDKFTSHVSKMKKKLKDIHKSIKEISNDIIVEINNL